MADVKKTREEWLDKYGFNSEMTTFIYFPNNSYEVKEELKQAGFRFSKELLWHCAVIPEGYEDKVVEVTLQNVAEMTAWGQGLFKPEVKQIINDLLKSVRPVEVSTSEWIGIEKDRLYDIPVVLTSIREMETRYGYTKLVKFETAEGNLLQWWTTVNIPFEKGDKLLLTGTVKAHDEYNGVKYTTMARCKMKEAE